MNRTDQKEFVNGPVWRSLKKSMIGACIPIIVGATESRKILTQGTVTICVTGDAIFGITAAHVVRGVDDLAATEGVSIYINKSRFKKLPVIDINDQQDIATIELDRNCLVGIDFLKASWPAQENYEGPILMCGYPAQTTIDQLDHFEYQLFHMIGNTQSSTHERLFAEVGDLLAPDGAICQASTLDLGGASGGPIFSVFEARPKTLGIALCGIITEAHALTSRVVGARIDTISSTGKISRRFGVF
ncbi:hypothetical protein BCF46_3301 [Litoreibacter meonggei]|uniref:Trypsin-like peptidase n=1 Tax=Litoreibacter meonggei TaxID=1049199 RepID=A0A497VAW4_9RHOB|nr:trypsin-like peptidase domain-containing protein [Litoreibacter meonggei]RLJ40731.1 hypothetical protein BCF46_3301 [Litoreibacter meonggei]